MAMIARILADWYAQAARPLPFREQRDPYAIWVSEIMAQQTRIAALLPYYARFMAAFPTVQHLAAASVDDVLALWAGLGYYSRARLLHKAANIITTQGMPADYAGWRALPGIGDYTAAAIASIAFEQPIAAVDGNVLRVFARLTAYENDILAPQSKKDATIWTTALHQAGVAPSVITQALMELGALICTPKSPNCQDCPLRQHCQAFKQGNQNILPVRLAKTTKTEIQRPVFVIIDQERRVLFRKRTEKLLHGLYEFPDSTLDLPILERRALPPSRHVFTHLVWHMQGEMIFTTTPDSLPDNFRWTTAAECDTLAIPTAFKTYVKSLREYWAACHC
ncbi:MAG: A/G-specific adenine glycosylase [Oscillospiraceae bacterium]|nr:A/G-specific adenine glycosylase [Oscillospiraceae bacterium]